MLEKIKERLPFLATVILYIVTSWGILQVIDILEANLILPPHSFRFALVVFLIGLPFVCITIIIVKLLLNPLYADAQTKSAKTAKKSVFLLLHSFDKPPSKYPKSREVDEALKKAIESGVVVKLLAPGGVERARGIYEASEIYGLDIRVADHLEDQDLRFTLMDDNIAIISHQRVGSKKYSRRFTTIKSERLCHILKNYYEEIWVDERTMSYEQYILNLLHSLNAKNELASLQRCSDRLNIPTLVLLRILNNK